MNKKRWSILEEKKAQKLLKSGLTAKETALKIGISFYSISKINGRKWHISLKNINIDDKRSRAMLAISDQLRERAKGRWSGKNNPNYGAKIVKKGKDNPLSIWKSQNPGYQDGEKNPAFGKKMGPEEIKRRTKKIVAFAHSRSGKTYKEIFGEERAVEIGRAMSRGTAIRLSKQKTSNTKPELKMKEILKSLNIPFVFQYPIDYYCVDFFIPSYNLVILTDGCYWHGCPKHFSNLDNRQRNRIRLDHSCDSFLKNRGYKVLRFWECEMSQLDSIKNQIKLNEGVDYAKIV